MIRTSRHVAVVVSAIVLAAGAAGCGSASIPFIRSGVDLRGGSWIVEGDVSLDTTPATRQEAVRVVGLAAKTASASGGTLSAAPFQRNALSAIDWPIDHVFGPSPGTPSNSYYHEQDLSAQRRAVERKAEALLRGRRNVQGSDIIGGLWAAQERFAANSTGPHTLLIVSNMLAYSPSDGLLLTQQALAQGDVDRLVKRLQRAHRIPDLSGVCVYVIGAGLDADAGITTAKELGLRRFWAAVFDRAHARLVDWEPHLTVAPECRT